MASSSVDPTTGAPRFADDDAPDVAQNATEVALFAAKVGTRIIGTNAQRLAYPYARDGLSWWNTTDDKEYIHFGTDWVAQKQTLSGTHTISSVGAGGNYPPVYWSGLQTVTFSKPFSSIPSVSLSALGEFVGFSQINNVTLTGFTYRLARIGSAPNAGQATSWQAVGV